MTTYYTYDSFNRLSQVLDQNNNILKDYTYHYNTQPAPLVNTSNSATIYWSFDTFICNDADNFKIYVNGTLLGNTNEYFADRINVTSGDVVRIEVSIASIGFANIGAFIDVLKTNDYSTSYYASGYVTNLTETYQFTWDSTYGDLDILCGSDLLGVYH
jgi:hypothetical protein